MEKLYSKQIVKVAKVLIGLVLAFVVCTIITLFTGCKSTKVIEYRDSIRTEIRYKTIKVPDTVYVDIPSQSETVIVKDSSRLDNDYSWSFARINADGTLFHSLQTKGQHKPIVTEKIIEYRDSIVYKDKIVTEEKEIEKKLNWWQNICINGFPFAASIILIFIMYIIFRIKLGHKY